MIRDLTSLYLFHMERVVRGKPAQSSSFTWTFFINNITTITNTTIFTANIVMSILYVSSNHSIPQTLSNPQAFSTNANTYRRGTWDTGGFNDCKKRMNFKEYLPVARGLPPHPVHQETILSAPHCCPH